MAYANGNTRQPTQPATVPQPVAPPSGAGPAPEVTPPVVTQPTAVMTAMSNIPMLIPIIVNKNVLSKMPCQPNISVLVPITVDNATATRILNNRCITVALAPVTVPVVANQQVANRVLTGAGPCPVSIDQTAIGQLMSSPNIVVMPMMSPVVFSQQMMDAITSGQPVMLSQSSFANMCPPTQSIMMMPMMLNRPATPLGSGRGPCACGTLSREDASRVLCAGNAMVAMNIDRQSLNSMMGSSNISWVVPMMAQVQVPSQSVCPGQ